MRVCVCVNVVNLPFTILIPNCNYRHRKKSMPERGAGCNSAIYKGRVSIIYNGNGTLRILCVEVWHCCFFSWLRVFASIHVWVCVCVPQQLINRMRKQRARVKEGLSERACAVGNSVNTTVQWTYERWGFTTCCFHSGLKETWWRERGNEVSQCGKGNSCLPMFNTTTLQGGKQNQILTLGLIYWCVTFRLLSLLHVRVRLCWCLFVCLCTLVCVCSGWCC